MRALSFIVLVGVLIPFVSRADSNGEDAAKRLVQRGLVRLVSDGELRRPVAVTLESDNPALELIAIAGQSVGSGTVNGRVATVVTTTFDRICRAPCNQVVEGHFSRRYLLSGEGIPGSEHFELPDAAAVRIKAIAGSPGRARGAFAMYLAGLAGLVTGGVFGLAAIGEEGRSRNVKLALIGGGAGIAFLVGGALLSNSAMTKFKLEPIGDPAPPKTADAPAVNSI